MLFYRYQKTNKVQIATHTYTHRCHRFSLSPPSIAIRWIIFCFVLFLYLRVALDSCVECYCEWSKQVFFLFRFRSRTFFSNQMIQRPQIHTRSSLDQSTNVVSVFFFLIFLLLLLLLFLVLICSHCYYHLLYSYSVLLFVSSHFQTKLLLFTYFFSHFR